MSGQGNADAILFAERFFRGLRLLNFAGMTGQQALNYGANLLNTLIVRTIGDGQPSPTCHSRDDVLITVAPVLERYGRFADFVDLALDEDQWG
jgi:hypothetical protein